MNAQELFLKGGKSVGVFFCGECRNVRPSQELAEQCCQNYKCRHCQADTGGRTSLICDACWKIERAEEERGRFEKSEKLTAWDGWVFCDSVAHTTGYFKNIAELLERCTDGVVPEYAWTCTETQFVQAHVSDIIGGMEGDAPEDFDFADLDGLDELKAALQKFNEVNAGKICFMPDYKRSVLIPKQPEPAKAGTPNQETACGDLRHIE